MSMSKLEEWKKSRVSQTQVLKAVEYRKAGGNADCSNCIRSDFVKSFPHLRCAILSKVTGFQEMVSRHKTCNKHLNPATVSTCAKS